MLKNKNNISCIKTLSFAGFRIQQQKAIHIILYCSSRPSILLGNIAKLAEM